MKVNHRFVKFYNDTFKFINKVMGLEVLIEYMRKVCPILVSDLQMLVKVKGLHGAKEYWNRVLTEEKAIFAVNYKHRKFQKPEEVLELHISRCPSINALDEPCREYCRHCAIVYGDLFEQLGYTFQHQNFGGGKCSFKITTKE